MMLKNYAEVIMCDCVTKIGRFMRARRAVVNNRGARKVGRLRSWNMLQGLEAAHGLLKYGQPAEGVWYQDSMPLPGDAVEFISPDSGRMLFTMAIRRIKEAVERGDDAAAMSGLDQILETLDMMDTERFETD